MKTTKFVLKFYTGTTIICLFTNVAIAATFADLYLAVKVLLPVVSPVTQNVALCWYLLFAKLPEAVDIEEESLGTAPEAVKLIYAWAPAVFDDNIPVSVTIALPEGPILTEAVGPTVAKSV